MIDFDSDPKYADPLNDITNDSSKSALNELFEVLLFNNRVSFKFSKNDLINERLLTRTSFSSEEEIEKYFTDKFEKEMTSTFFQGEQAILEDIASDLSEGAKIFNWIYNKSTARNVWQIWKFILKAASEQTEGEEDRKEREKYQKINTSQILLFSTLIGMKKQMGDESNIKYNPEQYGIFLGDLDLFLLNFESQAILSSKIFFFIFIEL